MKAKINLRMCIIGGIAIVLTAIIITASFYKVNEVEIWNELEYMSRIFVIASDDLTELKKLSGSTNNHYRVTLIGEDGTVLLDSRVDCTKMENHSDREEVILAKKNGVAQVTRISETIGKSTRYYAISAGKGKVLRVALDTDTIKTTYVSIIPLIVLVAFCAFALCYILSRRLTRGLIKPIEEMAAGNIEAPYPELEPFSKSIKERAALEKVKMEFTANVSHELKTPLTSISGYAELIESGMAKEKDIKKFAGKIYGESKRMIILIEDIMKLSELEEPGTVFHFERFSLAEVVRECFTSLELQAKKNNVKMSMEGKEVFLNGDRKMISEVVYNLCDNAIRYNHDSGKVRVSFSQVDDEIYFSVSDNGIGIPKEYWDDIFRRFYRVDKSRSKETGGTGLGLAIVKHICELHGAKIKVDSTEGKGTQITIIFKPVGEK